MLELSLDKQVCIVTGAAMGIGASCAEMLYRAGARLILVDIHLDGMEQVKKSLDLEGENIAIVLGDTSDPATSEKAVQIALKKWQRLDSLVNNAAINIRETALGLQMKNWERIMDVNLKGYILFAREAGHVMVQQKRGSIVNVSSELSFVGSKTGQLAYSTAKGGINQMTRTLAAEWAEHGVRVNAVAPGLTETPLVEQRLQDPVYRQACLAEVPLKRLGKPADIAHAVAFLVSPWADFITGQVLTVDGGYTVVR